jgi:hypothetical protein
MILLRAFVQARDRGYQADSQDKRIQDEQDFHIPSFSRFVESAIMGRF